MPSVFCQNYGSSLVFIFILFFVGPKWFCAVEREDQDGPEQQHRCHGQTPRPATQAKVILIDLFILSKAVVLNEQMSTYFLFMVFVDGWHQISFF